MEIYEEDPRIHILYVPVSLNLLNIEEIHASLKKIEDFEGPSALILTSKHPKIFCAGMDLKFIKKNGILSGKHVAEGLMKVLARLLKLRCPIVSAINGHAVAGGLLLALCGDFVVMNEEFGSVGMPEILRGLAITSGSNLILKLRLIPTVHRDLVLRGVYLNSKKAKENKVVDLIVPKADLLPTAIKEAKSMLAPGGMHQVVQAQRTSIYRKVIEINEQGKYDPEFFSLMQSSKL